MNLCLKILLAVMVAGGSALSAANAQSQDADVCDIYAAALDRFAPDSTHRSLVVYDSVSLAAPTFAFLGWASMGLPKPPSKVPLTATLWDSIRATYSEREALPTCVGRGRQIQRLPWDSLRAPFQDKESGWKIFAARFPGARGLHVLGRPYFLDAAHTEAMLYVASATYWSSGSGRVVYLRKEQGRWQAVDSHAIWVS